MLPIDLPDALQMSRLLSFLNDSSSIFPAYLQDVAMGTGKVSACRMGAGFFYAMEFERNRYQEIRYKMDAKCVHKLNIM